MSSQHVGRSAPGIDVRFHRSGSQLSKIIEVDGCSYTSSIVLNGAPRQGSDATVWWHSYLRGFQPQAEKQIGELRVAELFCGPGGLAQGVKQFCREVGLDFKSVATADIDESAVAVYTSNHRTEPRFVKAGPDGDMEKLVKYEHEGVAEKARFRTKPSLIDPDWKSLREEGGVDLLLAGPPCQGHSNLNIKKPGPEFHPEKPYDLRNLHYLDVPAMAVALDCPMVIIENVPAVRWDKKNVVETARRLFLDAGYKVETGVLKASAMGWPQNRSRYFMVASRIADPLPLDKTAEMLAVGKDNLDLWWAISEYEEVEDDGRMFRQANRTPENNARINYLFENGLHDLPDSQRPPCHSEKEHSYKSVYGRLKKDMPAPTITSGFLTIGRGRYIHPTKQRTLNPKEAARLQGFPDDYVFDSGGVRPGTAQLVQWIGDAVPMPLGYAAALSALGGTLNPIPGSRSSNS